MWDGYCCPRTKYCRLTQTPKSYHINGEQVIFHNLGTGLAGLSIEHIQIIQVGLQTLEDEIKNGQIEPIVNRIEKLEKKENSEIPVPPEYEPMLYRPPVKGREPVRVGEYEFMEGMKVLRKGKECIIKSIDRAIEPPSCTVLMLDTGSQVGTELQLLLPIGAKISKPMQEEEEVIAKAKPEANDGQEEASTKEIQMPIEEQPLAKEVKEMSVEPVAPQPESSEVPQEKDQGKAEPEKMVVEEN